MEGEHKENNVRKKGVATKAWLVISKFGKSSVEEVGKHSVMRRTKIPARDLRILDPALSYPSTILGRERAIVVNLEHIKAIITATEMLVLNPNDPVVSPFVRDLEHKLCSLETSRNKESDGSWPETDGSKVLPFEFLALENCLEFACRCLESETCTMEQEAYPALDELSARVSTLNLQRVRVIKSRLVALCSRVQKVRDELEHLLDDDMDMMEMYLSVKLVSQQAEEIEPEENIENGTLMQDDDSDGELMGNKNNSAVVSEQKPKIEELEMILEAYFVQFDGTLNKLSTMREYVDDTEDYINIIMNEKQNELLQVGVVMSTALIIINVGIVTAGIMGINIRIPLFDNGIPSQFYECAAGIVGGIFLSFFLAILAIKKKGLLG